MFSIAIVAIIPIVLILMLGYYSSAKYHFNLESTSTFNFLVLQYLLPFSLFASISSVSIKDLYDNVNIFLIVFCSLSLFMFFSLFILKCLLKNNTELIALRSLAYSSAAIPFIGTTIFNPIMSHSEATVIIVAGSFAVAVIQQPIAFLLLSARNNSVKKSSLSKNLLMTLREPVVYAPILGIVLLLFKVPIPGFIIHSGQIMGAAIPAISMFTSGIILHTQRIIFNKHVIFSIFIRNILTPTILLVILKYLSVSSNTITFSILAISIPVGSVIVILAIKFNTLQREMASVLFFSTVLSILTIPFLLWLTQVVL